MRRHSVFKMTAVAFDLSNREKISAEYFSDYFPHFLEWLERDAKHADKIKALVKLHFTPQMTQDAIRRIPNRTMFSLEELSQETRKEVERSAAKYKMTTNNLLYVFDVCYRYLLYQATAGENEYYLPHPLRQSCLPPGLEQKRIGSYQVPISFAGWAARYGKKMRRDEFIDKVVQLRHVVHEAGISQKDYTDLSREDVRELAEKLGLPAILTIPAQGMAATLAGLGVDVAGYYAGLSHPEFGLALTIGGWAITTPTNFCSIEAPKQLMRHRGLRWALDWPYFKAANDPA